MEFSEQYLKAVQHAVKRNKDKIWLNARKDFQETLQSVSEAFYATTGGQVHVTVSSDSAIDGYKDCRLQLWDPKANQSRGMIDRYLVPENGRYPILLIVPHPEGSPPQHLALGDVEALRSRMFQLLADSQSPLVQCLADHYVEPKKES